MSQRKPHPLSARHVRSWLARPSVCGFLFVSPWLIGFLIWTAGPILDSLWLSLHTYDLVSLRYVGLENYRRLLTSDPLYWKSLDITVTYAVVSVPLGLAGSLAIALLLNQKVRGVPVFRTLFYLPSLVPAVASSLVWQWIFDAHHGLLNQGLELVGLPQPEWLQDEKWTLAAFVLMSLWGIGGARMVIFLAGLQGIPDSYYEAARLDGAGDLQQFRHITLPLLSPVTFFNLIMGIIGSLQLFTQAYVMTSGGPHNASLFYSLSIFRNAFEYFKFGKACAMAWLLLAIILALSASQFALSRRWVHYESEAR